jgi:hypothetical protein
MSAVVSTTPLLASPVQVEAVEKKVRVPTTLPAKYGKFIQFGYYLMNKMNAVESIENQEEAVPLVDEQLFLAKLGIFDTLDSQQALVQEFFDTSKTINAEIRKMVHQRKRELAKADKPKKEKKVRVPKVAVPEDPTAVKEPKKGKAKKGKLPTSEDQLVNELVQLATAAPSADKKADAMAAVNVLLKKTSPIADKVKEVKEKVVKEKVVKEVKEKVVKEKVVKEPKEKVVKEVKEVKEPKEKVVKEVNEVKEPKEKVVKEVKEKVVKEKAPSAEPVEEDELQVSVFEFQDKKYLIDDNNNVYDFDTQDVIGTFANGVLSLTGQGNLGSSQSD